MKKKLYLCIVSFHHASRQINEPGWNFCFKETSVAKQMLNKGVRQIYGFCLFG